jgi:hypothetical protein
MIDFWDITFDDETLADNEDFIEGILKLGFERVNDVLYVKEIVNNYGNVIKDGILIDLKEKKLVYYPEPECTIKIDLEDGDVEKVDNFLRNNII